MKTIMKKTVLSLCAAILLLFAACAPTPAAEPMTPRTLALLNKPGVVLVYTEYTADITWYDFEIDFSIWDAVYDDADTLLAAGYITEATYGSALAQLFAYYIMDYAFFTGGYWTDYASTGGVGTGFIITPDGYLITNAHVVKFDEDELYYMFAVGNLQPVVESEVIAFDAIWREAGYVLTEEDLAIVYESFFWLYANTLEISDLRAEYTCFMSNVLPGEDISAKGIQMELCQVGIPGSSSDIAILKMPGSNLPTVTLGDSSKVRTGDQIYAMGFPANSTIYGVVEIPQAMQEPTMTQGIISARKVWTDGGGEILQTDAAIHGGNSGGPLFNADGEVIGINTFGLIDPETGVDVAGAYFAIPINAVSSYLSSLHITPSESKFTADFKAAVAFYNSGKYQKAIDLLVEIDRNNPGYPVIQEFLADVRAGLAANPPSWIEENWMTLVIIAAAVVVVIVLVIIMIVVLKKRKKRARQKAQNLVQSPTPQLQYQPQITQPQPQPQIMQPQTVQPQTTPLQPQVTTPQPMPQIQPQQPMPAVQQPAYQQYQQPQPQYQPQQQPQPQYQQPAYQQQAQPQYQPQQQPQQPQPQYQQQVSQPQPQYQQPAYQPQAQPQYQPQQLPQQQQPQQPQPAVLSQGIPCGVCGTPVTQGVIYCTKCGNKVG